MILHPAPENPAHARQPSAPVRTPIAIAARSCFSLFRLPRGTPAIRSPGHRIPERPCGRGGTGRRSGLKIRWPSCRGGSTPPARTRKLGHGIFKNSEPLSRPLTVCNHLGGRLHQISISACQSSSSMARIYEPDIRKHKMYSTRLLQVGGSCAQENCDTISRGMQSFPF